VPHKDPIVRKEYHRQHRLRNLTERRAKNLKWQQDNWEHRQEYMRRYYAKNRGKIRKRTNSYYHENREACLEKQSDYAKNRRTPEQKLRVKQASRRYQKSHWPKYLAHAAKRRAAKAQLTIDAKGIERWMVKVRSRPFSTCYYCKSVIVIDLHFDHIVPVSRGGEHSLRNLCVSCSACNYSKGAKPLSKWPKRGQLFLEI
jgi:5-methylcytosine-specific restriction endonuclease McrA